MPRIEAGARLGPGVVVGAGAFIGADAEIGPFRPYDGAVAAFPLGEGQVRAVGNAIKVVGSPESAAGAGGGTKSRTGTSADDLPCRTTFRA